MAQPDFTGIGDLFGIYQQSRQKAARDQVLGQLGQGSGPLDYSGAARSLLAAGDTEGGLSLAKLAQQQYLTSPDYITQSETAKAKVAEQFAPKTVDVKRPGPFGDTVTETMERGVGGIRPLQVQGQPQAGPSGGADASLTGPDFLRTLPPGAAAIVQKVANYEINPSQLSTKGGHRENIMAAASRLDPNFDAALAPARFAAIKEFNAGGPNSPAGTITAGNTAIQHLKTVSDASEKIGGFSNLGPLNSIANRANVGYLGASNDTDLVKYNNAMGRFVEEATKFYRGVGGAEADIKRAIDAITAAQSPQARNEAIATQAELMASKINALQDRWKQATGPSGWNKITKDFPIVHGKSAEGLDAIFERAGKPKWTQGSAEPGQTQTTDSPAPQVQPQPQTQVSPDAWKSKDTITAARSNQQQTLAEAQAKIAKNPANRDQVIQRLRAIGIDPSPLMGGGQTIDPTGRGLY